MSQKTKMDSKIISHPILGVVFIQRRNLKKLLSQKKEKVDLNVT